MTNEVFSITSEHPPREGLTISVASDIVWDGAITYFSLGRGTDISPETYDSPVLYLGLSGCGEFQVGTDSRSVGPGGMLALRSGKLCGIRTQEGFVYTEIMSRKELIMNQAVKVGEVIKLGELVPYENGGIVNMDIASNDAMKFAVMAFDEGTGLPPHRAPGDALIFALEGKAVIGYEGENHEIQAGENFRFAKDGLHSVTAKGKFKMALLLTLK